jgi:hypothetical protein
MTKWLLEDNVFEEDLNPLINKLKRTDTPFKIISYVPFQSGADYLELFEKDDCVIFYGSLNFGAQIRREASWVPGVYCNMEQFDCTFYYPIFGSHLLNSHYIMMPLGDLIRNKDFLLNKIGNNGCVFIRPNSGNKCFTGDVVCDETWNDDIEKFRFYDVEDKELCVVSTPQNITYEWGLIIAKNQVISGSQYKPKQTNNLPSNVVNFGNKMAQLSYEPDPVWVLDICQLKNGSLKIIEVNSFSCSGLYACDMNPIVENVSRLAEKDWRDIYCI